MRHRRRPVMRRLTQLYGATPGNQLEQSSEAGGCGPKRRQTPGGHLLALALPLMAKQAAEPLLRYAYATVPPAPATSCSGAWANGRDERMPRTRLRLLLALLVTAPALACDAPLRALGPVREATAGAMRSTIQAICNSAWAASTTLPPIDADPAPTATPDF